MAGDLGKGSMFHKISCFRCLSVYHFTHSTFACACFISSHILFFMNIKAIFESNLQVQLYINTTVFFLDIHNQSRIDFYLHAQNEYCYTDSPLHRFCCRSGSKLFRHPCEPQDNHHWHHICLSILCLMSFQVQHQGEELSFYGHRKPLYSFH